MPAKPDSHIHRLRLGVTAVGPKHVGCSVFQSDNAGTNWACSGSLTFGRDWFTHMFGEPKLHRRLEVEISDIREVKG